MGDASARPVSYWKGGRFRSRQQVPNVSESDIDDSDTEGRDFGRLR